MRNSKAKGGSYERKVARLLGIYFYNDADALWRGDSGTRATLHHAKKSKHNLVPGDIIPALPISVDFPIAVECKDDLRWTFDSLLKPVRSWLLEWWLKHSKQCAKSGHVPWLVFKKNHHPTYVMMYQVDVHPELRRSVKAYGSPALTYRGLAQGTVMIFQFQHVQACVWGAEYLTWLKERQQHDLASR